MRDADGAAVAPAPLVPPPTAALFDLACLAAKFRNPDASICTKIEEIREMGAERLRDEFVPENRPVVLRSVLQDWRPVERWSSDEYLRAAAPDAMVSVRRVDAAGGWTATGGGEYKTEEVAWSGLVDAHAEAEAHGRAATYYAAQLRLRTALPGLFADVHPVPPCVGALGPVWRNAPSAYFGCGHASPLHFDQLENILCVVRGRKQITLWHPADAGMLYPADGGQAAFSIANVHDPHASASFPLLEQAMARALHVELAAGDALYIPICWWHAVRTPVGERSISVSYWCQQPFGKAEEPQHGEWDDE